MQICYSNAVTNFLRLLKYRLFRMVFVLVLIFVGLVIHQNWPDSSCKDCNIILISIDTLRPDHMGIYGYSKNTTPNIDKFAKNSFTFTNMRTMVPATLPSFGSLMTGTTPFESNIYNNIGIRFRGKLANGVVPLPDTLLTFAQILKDQNYATGAYVTNSSLNPKLTNIDRGFNNFNFINDKDAIAITDKMGYVAFFKKSLDWITKQHENKFFLWLHLTSPHAPYTPPEEFQCKFGKEFCAEIKSKGVDELEKERKQHELCDNLPSSNRVRLFESLYDGEIAFDDSIIGEILKQVSKMKISKNTLIILYGDHGEGFDHDYYFIHSNVLYDSAIHIPFIIIHPKISGKKISTPLDNSQILPTLLDILKIKHDGITTPSFFSSIKTLSLNNIFSNNNYHYAINNNLSKYAVYDNNYKYIYSYPDSCLYKGATEELFDIKKDPGENNNLAKKMGEITKKYKKILTDYLAQYNLPQHMEWYIDENNINPEQKEIIEKLKSVGY